MSNAAQKNDSIPTLPEGARKLVRAGAPKDENGQALKPTTYTRMRPLKDEEKNKGNVMQLTAGTTISGVYSNSFVDKLFGKTNYVITTANGDVVIAGAGNLDSRLKEVAQGSYVEITYKGKSEMKSGKWAGKSAHNFDVLFEEV